MRRIVFLAAVAVSVATVTIAAVPTGSAGAAETGNTAIGTFTGHPTGVSIFTQNADGSIRVVGAYTRLDDRRSYFTVIYGNTNCDPAQAFPIGPFTTDRHGTGYINQTATNPNNIQVGQVMSVSVRRGDNQRDLDGDGKLGPTDVVAVPGSPKIGLIQCDQSPTVF